MGDKDPPLLSWKEHTFLDDLSLYPEFSVLVRRQWLHHRIRRAFHKHRTAALLTFAAISVKLSGATAPSTFLFISRADGGVGGVDGRFAAVAEWVKFISEGLALDLLAQHFKGITSALTCLLVMAAVSLLAHPLLHNATPVLAVVVPSFLAWAIAVWGAGKFHWGLACGMSVGLLAACSTLKAVSFAQRQADAVERRASSRDGYGEYAKGVSADRTGRTAAADGTTAPPTATFSTTQRAITFSEFAYFMLTAPSLVCEPRLLRSRARRSPRITRAASELFHAALNFLAFHAACSALFAPALRTIATATVPFYTTTVETSDWLDYDGWAMLGADGIGGWLHRSKNILQHDDLTRGQWWEIAVAVASSVLVFSPMVHFMLFYGFWHCVCLGCAELWGYPDRDLYGPWWLLTDDPRALFRLWSSPVHRWMVSCVYRPMLEAGRALRRRFVKSDKKESGETVFTSASSISEGLVASSEHASGEENDRKYLATCEAIATSSSRSGLLYSSSATAITGRNSVSVARSPEGVGNCNPVGSEVDNDYNDTPPAWRFVSLLAVFTVSGLLHEATTFIAMRRTCWPFNSFCLIMSAQLHLRWGSKYPVLSYVSAASEDIAGGDSRRVANAKVGSEWRGWGAVMFYMGSSCTFAVVVEFLAWQWWRHTMQ